MQTKEGSPQVGQALCIHTNHNLWRWVLLVLLQPAALETANMSSRAIIRVSFTRVFCFWAAPLLLTTLWHAQMAKVGPFPRPMDTPNPFLFLVYHNDKFPEGNSKMEAPRKGNGADFDVRYKPIS